MTEILFGICAVFLLLFVVFGFFYLPKRLQINLRILTGVFLIAGMWIAAEPGKIVTRVVLTLIILASLAKAFSDYLKIRKHKETCVTS